MIEYIDRSVHGHTQNTEVSLAGTDCDIARTPNALYVLAFSRYVETAQAALPSLHHFQPQHLLDNRLAICYVWQALVDTLCILCAYKTRKW